MGINKAQNSVPRLDVTPLDADTVTARQRRHRDLWTLKLNKNANFELLYSLSDI